MQPGDGFPIRNTFELFCFPKGFLYDIILFTQIYTTPNFI